MASLLIEGWEGILPAAQAAHDEDAPCQAWLARLGEALRGLVVGALGQASWCVAERDDSSAPCACVDASLEPLAGDWSQRVLAWTLSAPPSNRVTTARRELAGASVDAPWKWGAPGSLGHAAPDALVLSARVEGGGWTCWIPTSAPLELSSIERNLLLRLVHHVDTGLCLRLGGAPRFVLRSNGELTTEGRPPSSGTYLHTPAPLSASETWRALAEGRLTAVPRTSDHGERVYVICATDRRPLCVLSQAELLVVGQAARGLSNKQIALELSVSESFVSRALGRATFRLGCVSRHDLVRMAALLLGPPPESALPESLTTAECEVLELLRSGRTNAEIAALRATSPRTVANQIARVLRKLGAGSRRQVALG